MKTSNHSSDSTIATPLSVSSELNNGYKPVIATEGVLTDLEVPEISVIDGTLRTPLQFPLDEASMDLIKKFGNLTPVAINKRERVNLDIRKSYHLLPSQLHMQENLTEQPGFKAVLKRIEEDLNIQVGEDQHLKADLYKFLHYEEGTFFRRHKDHQRLPGMVGTLIVELPSSYDGGKLRVWSNEQLPHGEPSFSSGTSSTTNLSFTAFLSDLAHEVTEVTNGHRCVLVFTLMKVPKPVEFLCPLCSETIPPSEIFCLSQCSHQSCKECCVKWIETTEASGQSSPPTCFMCRAGISQGDTQHLLGRPFGLSNSSSFSDSSESLLDGYFSEETEETIEDGAY